MKINFEVTAVVDPDDGLQPSDLTPETASVRVMILKSNQVSFENVVFFTRQTKDTSEHWLTPFRVKLYNFDSFF